MADILTYAFGGLLKGAGAGFAEDGKAKRDRVLKLLDRDQEFRFRASENEKNRQVRTQDLEERRLDRGENRQLREAMFGEKQGLLVDKRKDEAWKAALATNKGELGDVNWEGVAADLDVRHPDLAEQARRKKTAEAEPSALKGDRAIAESTVREKMGWKDWLPFNEPSAGDIEAETRKETAARKGGGQPQRQPGTAEAGEPKAPSLKVPQGAGTRASPYKASTQADIEWFKKSAPKGAIIEVEGKLYTK